MGMDHRWLRLCHYDDFGRVLKQVLGTEEGGFQLLVFVRSPPFIIFSLHFDNCSIPRYSVIVLKCHMRVRANWGHVLFVLTIVAKSGRLNN